VITYRLKLEKPCDLWAGHIDKDGYGKRLVSRQASTSAPRGDIECGDYVVLPDVPGDTTANSSSQYFTPMGNINSYNTLKTGSIFTGTFMVTAVRHVGDSRNPDATSWVTTLDMVLQTTPVQVVPSLPVLAKATAASN
jgi:hypothetical protein